MPAPPPDGDRPPQVELPAVLTGRAVRLRPAGAGDIAALAAIRAQPQVSRWWRGEPDLVAELARDLADADVPVYVIELGGQVIGAIQWSEENTPDYRHATIDIYLDAAVHGRGLGADAIRTLARYLIEGRGHHRVTIDPAADNAVAVACYAKVGFRPIGRMRRYERGADGTWHDGLLMDLLAEELID